jgi:antitoxin Phd
MAMKRRRDPEMWNLQDAKARLSELVDRAAMGEAQIVLRRGQPAAVILPYGEYEAAKKPRESLFSFFQNSPLRGVELDLSRAPDTIDQMRKLDF